MDYRAELITLAEAFATATNRSLSRVSTMVRNDGKFFDRLRAGAGCTVDTYRGALQWFSDHWPEDAAWPEGVMRPTAGGQPDVGAPSPLAGTGEGDERPKPQPAAAE